MKMPAMHAGTLTALKWLALFLMTLDHVDWLVYGGALGIHATVGRVVFPIFGFVLGYNLARPTMTPHGMKLLFCRLSFFAGLSTMPYAYLTQGMVWHLNILWALAAAVGIVWLVSRGWLWAAMFAGLWLGVVVDYKWYGLAYVVAVWWAYSSRSPFFGPFWVAATLCSLSAVNGNFNALWAVPLLWIASQVPLHLARSKWAFYVYYPAHLVLLAGVVYGGVGLDPVA